MGVSPWMKRVNIAPTGSEYRMGLPLVAEGEQLRAKIPQALACGFLLALVLTLAVAPGLLQAANFNEQFTSTTYKDSLRTTALLGHLGYWRAVAPLVGYFQRTLRRDQLGSQRRFEFWRFPKQHTCSQVQWV